MGQVQVIPDNLDEWAPGPYLAAVLSTVDSSLLSDTDRVVVLRAQQRMASHFQAKVYEAMGSVVDSYEALNDNAELAADGAAMEVRAALRLTRRAADSEIGFSLALRERLPRVFQALMLGLIDVRRAKTIDYGTSHLPEETARKVVDRVIEDASRLTTGQLAARLRKLCVEADPEEAKQRFEEALEERRLVGEANETGTANLMGLDMAPEKVTAVTNRVNRLALSLNTKTESRSIDQLRADVFLDLLLGNTHGKQSRDRGTVHLTSDLETLTGLAEAPGELAGYGPVIADISRQVTQAQTDGQWEYAVTDPQTGQIYTGTTRRRPTAAQRRQVEAENPTCVFPGCRMPASHCDLDHAIPYAQGGPTTTDNTPPACRHDHVGRHTHDWTHQRLPNGDHLWTSPLGHTYTTSGLPP
jgi:hypothetical protein